MKLSDKLKAVGHLSTVLNAVSSVPVIDFEQKNLVEAPGNESELTSALVGDADISIVLGRNDMEYQVENHDVDTFDAAVEALTECINNVNQDEYSSMMIHTSQGVTHNGIERCTHVLITVVNEKPKG